MPERIEFLSAVLLTSEDPGRLAGFYREVLGLPLIEEQHGGLASHWGRELRDVHFAVHGEHPARAPGPIRMAFWVFDLEAFVTRLERHGVSLAYPIEPLGEDSLVTAVRDPDGNEVELTQMSASWVEHLAQRRASVADILARRRRTILNPGG
jgi:predicted enzyme related to lactoylglutathione lyase